MLSLGTVLDGRYEIKKIIGQGGMSKVYLAEDFKLGTFWAIKELDLSLNTNVDLLAEPEILKRLKHPNLPRIVDIIQLDHCIYIVEDYVEGLNLDDLIKSKGCQEKDIIKWAKQLCEILIYLHSQKPHPIIYRDMKPSNIIIDPKGDAWLVDFGIAREYVEGKSTDTTHMGTRGYAAPEQYGKAQTDERTDIYSLGVTLYHAATAKSPMEPPYEFLPIRTINPSLSEGLETIIAQCVKNDPDARYQSARELLSVLSNIHKLNREYKQAVFKKKMIIATSIIAGILIVYGGVELKQYREMESLAAYNEYYNLGVQAFKKEKYSEAEQYFRKAGEIKDKKDIHVSLAKTYLGKNENEKVVAYLIENINNNVIAVDSEIRYLLGTAYFNLNDYPKAIWYFEEAIKNEEEIADNLNVIYRDLAVSYGKVGEYDKAEGIITNIANNSRFEKHIIQYIHAEINILKRDYGRAKEQLIEAISMDADNTRYILTLARLYLDLNNYTANNKERSENYSKALSLLNELEKIDNNNILVLNDLGKTYYDYGLMLEGLGSTEAFSMFQQALIVFNRLADIGIEDINLVLNKGILLDKLGRIEEAELAYREALSLDFNHSRANLVYGLFQLKARDYKAAYHYFNKTVEVNQNDAEVATAQAKINELIAKGWIE